MSSTDSKIQTELPLVSVVILSYNRKNELKNTINKVFRQNYKNIEVIVVDNNSNDGSAEMVSEKFSEVILIKLSSNIGISGWNKGFKISNGKYILVLDDDSYPDEFTIEEGIRIFQNDISVGIVAFKIYNNLTCDFEILSGRNPPHYFVGCGALISSEVIASIGFFNELYFLYYNEFEYSVRLYNEGYKIAVASNSLVYHKKNNSNKKYKNILDYYSNNQKIFYHYSISQSIFILQNFYLPFSVIFFTKFLLSRFLVAFLKGFKLTLINYLLQLSKIFFKVIKGRLSISWSVQKLYKFGNMELLDRKYFNL